jgi:hypothetical protein
LKPCVTRSPCPNKGRGKGDGLFNAVRETVREAAGWTPAEREVLKTAAGQALEHLGLKKDDIRKELRPCPMQALSIDAPSMRLP